jgi:hypothetical protein
MPRPNDLSRSLVALDQNSTIIAVVELSQSSWLVGGVLPGIERQPPRSWNRAQNGCLPCCIAKKCGQQLNIRSAWSAGSPFDRLAKPTIIGRSGEPFPSGAEVYAVVDALEPIDDNVRDSDFWAIAKHVWSIRTKLQIAGRWPLLVG